MTQAKQDAADALDSLPAGQQSQVFSEPWEAQAFAMTLALERKGLFTWNEWASTLGEEIKAAQESGDPDTGTTYYRHWLAALERIVLKKGIATQGTLHQYRDAWDKAADRTPHGQPIVLASSDFS